MSTPLPDNFWTNEMKEQYILACNKKYRKSWFKAVQDKIFNTTLINVKPNHPYIYVFYKSRLLSIEYNIKTNQWILGNNGFH